MPEFQTSLCIGWCHFIRPSATSQDQRNVLRLDRTSRWYAAGFVTGPINLHRPHWRLETWAADAQICWWYDSTVHVRGSTSAMQSTAEGLIEWSQQNHMNINCKKTKEMINWLSDHSLRTVWHLCQSHLCLLNASRLTSCWALWSIHRWSGTIILMPLRPKQQRDFGSWKHSSCAAGV